MTTERDPALRRVSAPAAAHRAVIAANARIAPITMGRLSLLVGHRRRSRSSAAARRVERVTGRKARVFVSGMGTAQHLSEVLYFEPRLSVERQRSELAAPARAWACSFQATHAIRSRRRARRTCGLHYVLAADAFEDVEYVFSE